MGKTITEKQLVNLLRRSGEAKVRLPCGKVGILKSVEREDGSGNSFNLHVQTGIHSGHNIDGTGHYSYPVVEAVHVYVAG